MKEVNVKEIKARREKLNLSYTQLAKIAKISLATVQQVESGKQKPQSRTIKKITDALDYLEAKGPEAIAASVPMRKRGRPRKKDAKKAAAKPTKAAAKKPRKVKAAPAPKITKMTPEAVTTEGSFPIKLSNIDLELINRILNMTGLEKIDLLKKLM